MKFHQLPIGARFEYDGQAYVKTGPVAAAREHYPGGAVGASSSSRMRAG